MTKLRGGVVGLGWMGMLYDLANRIGDRFEIDDTDRPTPELDVHRKFYYHETPGTEGNPNSYSEALLNRPEIDLVSAADRDVKRLKAFSARYGLEGVYTDAKEMFEAENLDVVAVATNTKGRSDLVVMAVEHGAKAVITDKPMAHTVEEVDRMVKACADAGVPLSCGAITTTHPSFERAKQLIKDGEIGDVLSIETRGPGAQHQNWSYFLDSPPAWVIGTGDSPRRESGSDEFTGQGMLVAQDGTVVHFRPGGPGVRITGTEGELLFQGFSRWQLFKDVEVPGSRPAKGRIEMPFPDPQFVPPYGAIYSLDDVMRCLAGDLDEPKNSGRRVGVAIEVEVALKLSSEQGGARVELPLEDRSLGLNYDWYR